MNAVVEKIVAAIAALPPYPKVAKTALELLDDPNVSAKKLAEVVQLDAGLTANILKAVNSPVYGLTRKVGSVNQAFTVLGNERFREVVAASSAAQFLSDSQPGYDLPRGELWRHSLATGLMVRVLSEQSRHQRSPYLYTAALLHDIGKIILSDFIQDKVPEIMARVAKGRAFLEAERAVLGMDHAQLGGLIARKWNFAPDLAHFISLHHEPEKDPRSKDLAILYLADLLCKMIGLGSGRDGLALRGQEVAARTLGFKEKDLERAMAALHLRLQEAEALIETG